MAYKIPDQMKVKNIGVGWGGEPAMKKKVLSQFKKEGVPMKGMNNKMKRLEKVAITKGF